MATSQHVYVKYFQKKHGTKNKLVAGAMSEKPKRGSNISHNMHDTYTQPLKNTNPPPHKISNEQCKQELTSPS